MSMIYLGAPRSSLYFGQYEFGAHFHIPNVNLIRTFNEQHMRETVQHRTVWGTWRNWQSSACPTETQLQSLANMIEPLMSFREHSKLMFYSHWLYVYTNDQSVLSWFCANPQVQHATLYRAEVTQPTDVVFLREPRHPWRSYFRPGWLQPEQHRALLRFVVQRPDNFYITPGLLKRLESAQHRLYLHDHLFVEHSTMQDLTMLGLVLPQCFRRTMRVEAK